MSTALIPKVEEELLKGDPGNDDPNKKKRTIGKSNKEYRDFRRQSVKASPSIPQRTRQGSNFALMASVIPNTGSGGSIGSGGSPNPTLSPPGSNNQANQTNAGPAGAAQQERPTRPKGNAIPQQKKKAKEAVGKYLLGDALGRGQFGQVFKGVDSENGAFVAIKQLKSTQLGESSFKAFESEIELIKKLDHPNVVRYLDCVQTKEHFNLVLEFADGGALSSIIKRFRQFPEKLCAVYINQCLLGLEYLHSQNVVHRDIKAANILLTKNGKVKLADFGISTTANNPDGPDAGAGFGSPYWMAPEVIEMEITPNEKADIWSLGCTVIELLTGNPPYHEYHPMGAIVKCVQDEHPPFPPGISKELEDFLLKCFQKDIEKRASAKELLQHPWFFQLKESQAETTKTLEQQVNNVKPEKGEKTVEFRETKDKDGKENSKDTLHGNNNAKSIIVYGESIRKDTQYKAVYITPSTTCEEVVQLVLIKYGSNDDPSTYSMFIENSKTGESKQLEDGDQPLVYSSRFFEDPSLRFAIHPRPDLIKRKEGLLERKRQRKLPFLKHYELLRVVLDLDERYVAFYRGDRPSNDQEQPLRVIYNLRMIKDVAQIGCNASEKIFDFAVTYRDDRLVFRALNATDLEQWVKVFRKAISLARPLHLGASSQSLKPHKKNRESKVMGADELMIHRPRLSSGRSIQSSSSQVDSFASN